MWAVLKRMKCVSGGGSELGVVGFVAIAWIAKQRVGTIGFDHEEKGPDGPWRKTGRPARETPAPRFEEAVVEGALVDPPIQQVIE